MSPTYAFFFFKMNFANFKDAWNTSLGSTGLSMRPQNDDEWLALWEKEKSRGRKDESSKKDAMVQILEDGYAKAREEGYDRREWADAFIGDSGDSKAKWFFDEMMNPENLHCGGYGKKSGFYAVDVALDLRHFGIGNKQPTVYNYLCRFKNGEYQEEGDDEVSVVEQTPISPKINTANMKDLATKMTDFVCEKMGDTDDDDDDEEEPKSKKQKVSQETLPESIKRSSLIGLEVTPRDKYKRHVKHMIARLDVLEENSEKMQTLLRDIVDKTNERFDVMENLIKQLR